MWGQCFLPDWLAPLKTCNKDFAWVISKVCPSTPTWWSFLMVSGGFDKQSTSMAWPHILTESQIFMNLTTHRTHKMHRLAPYCWPMMVFSTSVSRCSGCKLNTVTWLATCHSCWMVQTRGLSLALWNVKLELHQVCHKFQHAWNTRFDCPGPSLHRRF